MELPQINTVAVRENMTDKLNDKSGVVVKGHIKIHDPKTGEVYVDKRNAIHYENMSIALAESLANQGQGMIYEMSFGNGGTSVDPNRYYYISYILTQQEQMQVCIIKHLLKL